MQSGETGSCDLYCHPERLLPLVNLPIKDIYCLFFSLVLLALESRGGQLLKGKTIKKKKRYWSVRGFFI